MSYVLSHLAEQDIDEIISYIAEDSIPAAHAFIDSLYDSFDMLVDNPLIGHSRKDITHQPVRFWTFKWHYLVVYMPENPLKIVRVLSGQRNLSGLL